MPRSFSVVSFGNDFRTGPDSDICVFGGHNQVMGQGGRLGPLWVQGKALVGGSGGEAPDGK